jgi:hypothetical protein
MITSDQMNGWAIAQLCGRREVGRLRTPPILCFISTNEDEEGGVPAHQSEQESLSSLYSISFSIPGKLL